MGNSGLERDEVLSEPAVLPRSHICGCRDVGVPQIVGEHVGPQNKLFYNPAGDTQCTSSETAFLDF